MTNSNEVRRTLIDLGAAPIEPVAPRMDALEHRLLSSIVDDDDTVTPFLVAGGGAAGQIAHRRLRWTLAAAAATVVLVICGALIARPSEDQLMIAAADGVEVVLPDGSTIDGAAGVELPDGAVLAVAGSLIVDGRRFGPGEYRVDDGELVPVVIETTSSAPVATQDADRNDDDSPPTSPATPARAGERPTSSTPAVDDSRPTTDAPARPTESVDEPSRPDAAPTRTSAPPPTTAPARPEVPARTTVPPRTTTTPPTTEPVRTTVLATSTTDAPTRSTAPATTARPVRPTTTTVSR